MSAESEQFFLRYYCGHKGQFGHEFLEFDITAEADGTYTPIRYTNQWNYRNDALIRKEMCVSHLMLQEMKRIVEESKIMKEDDTKWDRKNKDGQQTLEIRRGNEHISFDTTQINSLLDVERFKDSEGQRVFYYLIQDFKALVFSLISVHFKIKATPG